MKTLYTILAAAFCATFLSGCLEGGVTVENGQIKGFDLESEDLAALICPQEDETPVSSFADIEQYNIASAQIQLFDDEGLDKTNKGFSYATPFGITYKRRIVDKSNFAEFRQKIVETRKKQNPAFNSGEPVSETNPVMLLVHSDANEYVPVTKFNGGTALYERDAGRLYLSANFQLVFFQDFTGETAMPEPLKSSLEANFLFAHECQIQAEIFGVHTNDEKSSLDNLTHNMAIKCVNENERKTVFSDMDRVHDQYIRNLDFNGEWNAELGTEATFADGEILNLAEKADNHAFGPFLFEDGHVQLSIPLTLLGENSFPTLEKEVLAAIQTGDPNGKLVFDMVIADAKYPAKTQCKEAGDCPNMATPDPSE